MNPKIATILLPILFVFAGAAFLFAGFRGDNPAFYAVGGAFAVIAMVFLARTSKTPR